MATQYEISKFLNFHAIKLKINQTKMNNTLLRIKNKRIYTQLERFTEKGVK